jgi:hypothetical protein
MPNLAILDRFVGLFLVLTALGMGGNSLGEPLHESRKRGGLPNVFARLQTEQPTRIAYFGGSITEQPGWRLKSLAWFRAQFPKAQIEEINAALGGTGSDLGVFRLAHDVLDQHPDLLFVEFAVNDTGVPIDQIRRSMEGIVRQTWKANPATDICFVYTVAGNILAELRREQLPPSVLAMEQVADHYGIPSVNMGLEVVRLEKAGKLLFRGDLPTTDSEKAAAGGRIVFSPDGVHPYLETGHELYLQVLVRFLNEVRRGVRPRAHGLPSPLVTDNREKAKMLPLSRAKLSQGWQRLDPARDQLARQFGNRLPELWKATQPGQSISFAFRGSAVRIYDLGGPACGQVIIKLGGQAPRIEPRFDSLCTYHRLAWITIGEDLPNTVHHVVLTIHSQQPDKARILSQGHEKMDDPRRFDGTTWYAGAILLVGDVVEPKPGLHQAAP